MAAKKTSRSARLEMNMHRRVPFSRAEYERRYGLVLDGMRAARVDALLIRSPENITYLTGYETPGYYGYHCLILSAGNQPVLVGRRLEVNRGEKRALQENMTFHIVAGTMIPREFGTCTSASVRVTATGCEVLTTIPRKIYQK